jgi:hypothetical protein
LAANSQARNPSFVVDAPTQGNDPSPEAIRSEPADLFPVNIWVDPVSDWYQHRDERRENEIFKNQIRNLHLVAFFLLLLRQTDQKKILSS